jgi:hypothetical protein
MPQLPSGQLGFTAEEIINALHGAKRQIEFRYELLDANLNVKKELKNVESGEVNQNAEATIKRTMKITMTEDTDIDFLSDRIKPYVRFFIDQQKMSPAFTGFLSSSFGAGFDAQMVGKNGWIEFPLGVFLLTSPTRKDNGPNIIRDVDCYDGLLVLQEDKFAERHFIPSGTYIHDAVAEILEMTGITNHSIQESTKALEMDLEFETGKEKLEAINEILRSGVYEDLHCNADGVYVSNVYINPLYAPAEYAYKTDRQSVVWGGYEEELDYYNIPNKWVVVRSMSDRPPLVSTYTNENPNSPTSTVNRKRIILEKVELDNIPDQQTLDLFAERIAFEQSQVFGRVEFETGIMPFHDFQNVLDIEFEGLQGNGKYVEVEWSIPFETGGRMKHIVRRISEV